MKPSTTKVNPSASGQLPKTKGKKGGKPPNKKEQAQNGGAKRYPEDSSSEDNDDPNDASYVGPNDSTLHDSQSFLDMSHSLTRSGEPVIHVVEKEKCEESTFSGAFQEIEQHFMTTQAVINSGAKISAIVMARGQDFHTQYRLRLQSNLALELPSNEEIVYYNSYSGADKNQLWNVVKRHWKPFKNHGSKTNHGKGIYLSKNPDIPKALKAGDVLYILHQGFLNCLNYGFLVYFLMHFRFLKKFPILGIVACKIIPGRMFSINRTCRKNVPDGFQTKYVEKEEFYVVPKPEFILPLGVIYAQVGGEDGAPNVDTPNATHAIVNGEGKPVSESEIKKEMDMFFKDSLELLGKGKYMKPAEAIKTNLYPHQMHALSWMSERENTRKLGNMKGGILADDMGLGKTLTVLSLILSNFHDQKPLAKPKFGFKREPSRSVAKYMPNAYLDKNATVKSKRTTKDAKGKIKSSKNSAAMSLDDSFEENDKWGDFVGSDDEFDSMVNDNNSFSARVGIDDFDEWSKTKKNQFEDDLSDDEEYQNMTEEEKQKRFVPQLDGNLSEVGSDDEDLITSKSNMKRQRILSSDEEDDDDKKENQPPKVMRSMSPNLDDSIESDFDSDMDFSDSEKGEPAKPMKATPNANDILHLTKEQLENLIVFDKMPAKLNGRRR